MKLTKGQVISSSKLKRIEEATFDFLQDKSFFEAEINIIDVYEDLYKNRKSVTFRLSYQSFNETLSNKQIEESQNKILKLLKKNLNIELRK